MLGLLRVFLLVGFVVKFWWLILLVLAVVGAGFLLWAVVTRQDAELGRQRREQSALAARADEQHAWVLAGDDRGVHGEYRPEVYPTGSG
ncbi:MAG: hypothetical protein QOD88_4329 [Mycobacterium sp.]|jgi:hypothetical protein|nr:hypothetical protein [Mycobacterium sp.]